MYPIGMPCRGVDGVGVCVRDICIDLFTSESDFVLTMVARIVDDCKFLNVI